MHEQKTLDCGTQGDKTGLPRQIKSNLWTTENTEKLASLCLFHHYVKFHSITNMVNNVSPMERLTQPPCLPLQRESPFSLSGSTYFQKQNVIHDGTSGNHYGISEWHWDSIFFGIWPCLLIDTMFCLFFISTLYKIFIKPKIKDDDKEENFSDK